MDEIIREGRMRKEEAARERQELEDQRQSLDKDFSEIMQQLTFRPSKAQRLQERTEPDSYDKLLKELVFERKAVASERTKTPEELAREEAEKLEALERQRRARADGLEEDVVSEEELVDEVEVEEEGEGEEEEIEDDGEDLTAEAEQEDSKEMKEVDEDDKLGEDCIKLMTVVEADKPCRNYMKNGRGEDRVPCLQMYTNCYTNVCNSVVLYSS